MIQALIIEDEEPAALRLQNLIKQLAPDFRILETLDSVSGSIKWLKNNSQPDLIMLDIQLADGLSFEIFRKVSIDCFVIFTTAYDEFAIKAFELNSIDYLLKPINEEKLSISLEKFKKLREQKPSFDFSQLISSLESKKSHFKRRFLINMGTKIKSVETKDIAFFYVLEKNTFLCTFQGKNYPIDFSLDKLESLIDNELFFRINRQTMVNFKSILKVHLLSKSRIQIETSPKGDQEMLVSSNKSHSFRLWLDQ